MPITRLIIKGFQSHVDTDILLSPGLNVVTGDTNSGKTAIIRAIRWVALGEPTGEDFIHKDVGEAAVEIHTDDGSVVTKKRRKGKTTYILTLPGREESIYEKAEVPEDVARILGIYPSKFNDFESILTFAFQLEAPFLLSEPASAGAKVLGKLAGTEVIDAAIKTTATENRGLQLARTDANKAIERAEIDLLEYQDLQQLKDALAACEYLTTQVEKDVAKAGDMAALDAAYQEAGSKLITLQQTLAGLAIVPDLVKDVAEIEKAQQRYDTLLGLWEQLGRLETALAGYREEEKRYAGLAEARILIAGIEEAYARLLQLSDLEIVYSKLTEEAINAKRVIELTKDLDIAAQQVTAIYVLLGNLATLEQIADQYETLQAQRQRYQGILKLTAGIGQAAGLIAQLEADVQRLAALDEVAATYAVKTSTRGRAQKDAAAAAQAVKNYQEELKTLWAQLGVCPLCEQPIERGKHG